MAINVLELHKLMNDKYNNHGGVPNYGVRYGEILRINHDGELAKERSRNPLTASLLYKEPYQGIPYMTGQIYRLGKDVGVAGEPIDVEIVGIPLPIKGSTTVPHATISSRDSVPEGWDGLWREALEQRNFRVDGEFISKNVEFIEALVVGIAELRDMKGALLASVADEASERPLRFERNLFDIRNVRARSLFEEANAAGIHGASMGS